MAINKWKTITQLKWGDIAFLYDDELYFTGLFNFNYKLGISGSFLDVNKVDLDVALKPEDNGDQMVYMSYKTDDDVIHKGRFVIP